MKNSTKLFFLGFALLSLILFVSSAYAAKTIKGYADGQLAVIGIASTDRTGTLMITTNIVDAHWDNLTESIQGYTEDWQTHPAGPPADWMLGSGINSFVVTGANNYLQATALANLNARTIYTGTSTIFWPSPHDFSVLVTIDSTTSISLGTGSRIRMGIGCDTTAAGSLNAYQLYIYAPENNITHNGIQCYGALQLRDAQANNIDVWNYDTTTTAFLSFDGLTTGASFTLRILSRDPIPVYFSDSTRETITNIDPTDGVFVVVEDIDKVNYAQPALYDTGVVTLITQSGDSETMNVGERYANSAVLFNIDKLPLPARNYPVIPDNGILEGDVSSVVSVIYGSNTATATMGTAATVIFPDTATVTVGDNVTFIASGGPAPYTWSVDSPSIGSIDSTTGQFTALSAGTTIVTVTDAAAQTSTATAIVVPTSANLFNDESSVIIHRKQWMTEIYE